MHRAQHIGQITQDQIQHFSPSNSAGPRRYLTCAHGGRKRHLNRRHAWGAARKSAKKKGAGIAADPTF
jgi:hypothetical protein